MTELQEVFTNYRETKDALTVVPVENQTPALAAVRVGIPALFQEVITLSGGDPKDYLVKGSVGQFNFSFAAIPWVAVFHRAITKSAQDGYYIVLLFSEDMSSAYLSLNQGYTKFRERYESKSIAYRKIRNCADAAARELPSEFDEFVKGAIDLKADGDLGKGYQAASILAKKYDAAEVVTREQIQQDLALLLRAYEALRAEYPESLINMDVAISTDELIAVVEERASKANKEPATVGPQPRPLKGKVPAKGKYIRSIEAVVRATAMANFQCAFAGDSRTHESFVSAKSSRNYVEAHHLIPFSRQDEFENSLDVEENIVVLCPTCHRLLHHGKADLKLNHLEQLWKNREVALLDRGLQLSFDELKKMYKALDEDD